MHCSRAGCGKLGVPYRTVLRFTERKTERQMGGTGRIPFSTSPGRTRNGSKSDAVLCRFNREVDGKLSPFRCPFRTLRNGVRYGVFSAERNSPQLGQCGTEFGTKAEGGGWRRAYRITIGYGVRKHVLNRASLAYSLSTIDNKIFIRLLQVSSLLLRDHSYPRLRELSCEYHQFAKPCRQSIRKTTARIVVIACQELSTAFERPSDLRYAPICSICSPLRAY